MKEGEGGVGIAHGANFYGVGKLKVNEESEPNLIAYVLFVAKDYSDYFEYRECKVSADRKLTYPPIFVQRLKARTLEAAKKECVEICNSRKPPPIKIAVASKEAQQAREAVLAKTDFKKVVEAIHADNPELAAKLYADISTAISSEPHEDDKASVVRLRKLFKQRKAGRRHWQFLLVAHWDELSQKQNGEISMWLAQHGERGVSTDAVAKFMQRHRVKLKKTTK